MEAKKESVDLYPLRPSELVGQPDFLEDIEPLLLTDEEKGEVLEFEELLFGELKRFKDIFVSTHTIYPEAFVTNEGARLFSAVYSDEGLKDRLGDLAARRGVKLKETKVKRQVYDAFFDDLLDVVKSAENFQQYQKQGAVFTNLGKALDKLGDESEEPVVLKGEIPERKKLTKEEVEENFLIEIDLTGIPKRLRERMNLYSSDWTKDQFAQAFRETGGKVEDISNPERIARIVNVDKLIEKVEGLREFKQELKRTTRKLKAKDGNLAEAKRIVISLYQQYVVNIVIAGQYSRGRVLAAQPQRTERDEKALGLIKGISQEVKGDRFTPERASRTLEKIDHFLKGTSVQIGKDGYFETIPEKLAEYAQAKASELPPEETPEYQKYNRYQVNAQQARALADVMLQRYGFDQGDKAWSAVILDRKGTLAVRKREKGRKIREFRIPRSFERGLINTLVVEAHEVEGHVLRHVNADEIFGEGLQLIEEYSTGRAGILSEAAAVRIEDETKQAIVGMRKETLPYYYLALVEKQKGGSFKECFQVFFEAYAKRKYSLSLKKALEDEQRYQEMVDYVYPRALRIFRRNTPLDDTSGFLPTSDQLKYIEQELIVDVLQERGLGKLLHVAGMDLYSLQELRQLGMLDLSKVEEPRLVMAKEIWPQIKKALDEGKSLGEAIRV